MWQLRNFLPFLLTYLLTYLLTVSDGTASATPGLRLPSLYVGTAVPTREGWPG